MERAPTLPNGASRQGRETGIYQKTYTNKGKHCCAIVVLYAIKGQIREIGFTEVKRVSLRMCLLLRALKAEQGVN